MYVFYFITGLPDIPLPSAISTLNNDDAFTGHLNSRTKRQLPPIIIWGVDNMIVNVGTDRDPLSIRTDSHVPRVMTSPSGRNSYGKFNFESSSIKSLNSDFELN